MGLAATPLWLTERERERGSGGSGGGRVVEGCDYEEDKNQVFCSVVFSCSKLIWHSFIGGQKILIICYDRT